MLAKFWQKIDKIYFAIAMFATLFYTLFIYTTSFIVDGKTYFSLFDDAMVSMRYARNLSHGYGLVWNPGEAPIEGYTNFLWTIWMAILHLFPIPERLISLGVMVTGIMSLLLNLWIVKKIITKLCIFSFLTPFIVMLLLAFYYPLIYWTLRGMEVGILVLIINYAILKSFELQENFKIKPLLIIGLLFALALLIRLDVIIPCSIITIFITTFIPDRFRLRSLLILFAAFIIPIVSHSLFRIFYYGDILPNTYYLKVTGVSLLTRLVRGIGSLEQLIDHLYIILLFAILGFTIALGRKDKILTLRVLLLLTIFLGQFFYSLYVGGDAWEWRGFSNRYICTAISALLILCGLGLEFLLSIKFLHWLTVILGVILLIESCDVLKQVELPAVSSLSRFNLAQATILIIIGIWAFFLSSQTGNFNPQKKCGKSLQITFIFTFYIWYLVNIYSISEWLLKPLHIIEDINAVKLGIMIRAGTEQDATIAVVWAGNIPYFSQRTTIDLLGKNDRKIARSQPVHYFVPGHNKWNYRYSIGTYRPDAIAQLINVTEEEIKLIEELGYEELPNGIYIRKDSERVNREILSQDWTML
ncbi:MAG: hypothetical protein J7647_23655 [Cyanobacteria bacterium SBLK]|nr:hypothetical protein [Cyanobacteria bacterium SBLK]